MLLLALVLLLSRSGVSRRVVSDEWSVSGGGSSSLSRSGRCMVGGGDEEEEEGQSVGEDERASVVLRSRKKSLPACPSSGPASSSQRTRRDQARTAMTAAVGARLAWERADGWQLGWPGLTRECGSAAEAGGRKLGSWRAAGDGGC